MVVSLGPTSMSTALGLVKKNPRADGTGANPRCLRRDVNRNAAMGATADRAFSLITGNKEMNGFYNQLLGIPAPKNDSYPWGVSLPHMYHEVFEPRYGPRLTILCDRSTRQAITSLPSTLAVMP